MPQSVQAQPEVPYGVGVEVERNLADQAAAQAQGMAQTAEAAAPAMQAAAPGAPQQPMGQEDYTVRNPYMLLPASMNFPPRAKTPIEQRYSAGLLWEVLASDPQSSDLTRMIARSLLGADK